MVSAPRSCKMLLKQMYSIAIQTQYMYCTFAYVRAQIEGTRIYPSATLAAVRLPREWALHGVSGCVFPVGTQQPL